MRALEGEQPGGAGVDQLGGARGRPVRTGVQLEVEEHAGYIAGAVG